MVVVVAEEDVCGAIPAENATFQFSLEFLLFSSPPPHRGKKVFANCPTSNTKSVALTLIETLFIALVELSSLCSQHTTLFVSHSKIHAKTTCVCNYTLFSTGGEDIAIRPGLTVSISTREHFFYCSSYHIFRVGNSITPLLQSI